MLFPGEKPAGGFTVAIDDVLEGKAFIKVYYRETFPLPDADVKRSSTQPYHIKAIDSSDKFVIFERVD